MADIPINMNPDIDNYRRFKRGWKEDLAASIGQRKPYKDPDKNVWQATGFRYGYYVGITDEDEIDRAWEWSIEELRREGYIEVSRFKRNISKQ